MAKKRKAKPKTFIRRVTAWVRGNANTEIADASRDKELVAAARIAWQDYSNARPRTAALILSSTITLHQIYEMHEVFLPATIAGSLVDTLALEEYLRFDQLADEIVKALGGPPLAGEPDVDGQGSLAATMLAIIGKSDPRQLALEAIVGVGLDNATICLGMILLLNATLDLSLGYSELQRAVQCARNKLKASGKETT